VIKRFRSFVKHIFELRDSPHSIALGIAIGIFVGLTPTVGMQMVISTIVATFCNANRVAAISMVYITNPFTIIPVYSFIYYFGCFITSTTPKGIMSVLHQINAQESLIGKFSIVVSQGWSIQGPLWIGSVLIGILCAFPAYILVKRMVVRYREHAHRVAEVRIHGTSGL
jgi:hypothetical protein